jgi:carbon monoxide dehydrogenase subunit G
MKLEQSFEVAAPLDRVWAALIDVERVAPCLPGAEVTGRNDDGTYNGTFRVKIGPTAAAYVGKLQMETIDEASHSATMQAAGTDRRGQGGAKATIISSVKAAEGGMAVVEVSTDYSITGRLARFGRGGMIEEIGNRLLKEFASSLQAMLAGPGEYETFVGMPAVGAGGTAKREKPEPKPRKDLAAAADAVAAASEPVAAEAESVAAEAEPVAAEAEPDLVPDLAVEAAAESELAAIVPEASAEAEPPAAEVPQPSTEPEITSPQPEVLPAEPKPEVVPTAPEPGVVPPAPEPEVVPSEPEPEVVPPEPEPEPAPPPPTPAPPPPTPEPEPPTPEPEPPTPEPEPEPAPEPPSPPPPPPPPPPAAEPEALDGLVLVRTVIIDRVKSNPIPVVVLLLGFVLLRHRRRRGS